MKNSKLNIIKLNVITAILTSICISCAPFGNVNPNKLKNPITSKNLKKTKRSNNSRNLKNTSNHTNSENLTGNSTKNPSENNQNLENESQNSKSSNQNSQEETTISKLENIGKGLEAQKKEEDTQIAKIAKSDSVQYDFLETFKLQRNDYFMFHAKMKLKRIIYPSLNYDTKKILALKEILEKLDTDKNRRVAGKFLETSRDIQLKLEDVHLKKIQDILCTLSKKEAETLIQDVKCDLKIKQNFAKTLNATIDAYNKNVGGIRTNDEALANHIKNKYSHPLYLLNQAD
ncbi:complement regulator-acquiring protein [Borreliella burgdorferi]|uniref:complement regulator-acquiring protein n=1 Tax=Borreliella burgdorferi TaxID=139 RepID=UPI001E550A07|nr:complement regulator-acquiring protein [Borreliella burgdorferi]MCD2331716.1 complement regulator-acquiring protein [Borreliella burgdorferi]